MPYSGALSALLVTKLYRPFRGLLSELGSELIEKGKNIGGETPEEIVWVFEGVSLPCLGEVLAEISHEGQRIEHVKIRGKGTEYTLDCTPLVGKPPVSGVQSTPFTFEPRTLGECMSHACMKGACLHIEMKVMEVEHLVIPWPVIDIYQRSDQAHSLYCLRVIGKLKDIPESFMGWATGELMTFSEKTARRLGALFYSVTFGQTSPILKEKWLH